MAFTPSHMLKLAALCLSGVFAVLRQPRARVVSDEMRQGSGLFSVLAHLPVQASFGFVDDMRRRSSGAASASLMLSHWERLQVRPGMYFGAHACVRI